RRNTSRILVYIKRIVKMRDAQAFEIELGIEHNAGPKVGCEQLAILVLENLERQRGAAFLERMNDFLEFRKHCLPEESTANVVDLTVDNVGAHLRIVRLLEEIVRQQLFVKSRRHFIE